MSNNNQFSETNIIIALIDGISEDRAQKYCVWLHKQYPAGIPVCAIKNNFQQFAAL